MRVSAPRGACTRKNTARNSLAAARADTRRSPRRHRPAAAACLPAALAAHEQLARPPVDDPQARIAATSPARNPSRPATARSRSRAGRPSAPIAAGQQPRDGRGSSPRGSERSRRSATPGTAHTSGSRSTPPHADTATAAAARHQIPARPTRCASGTPPPRTHSRPQPSTDSSASPPARCPPGTGARPAHSRQSSTPPAHARPPGSWR